MDNLTEELAGFTVNAKYGDFPTSVVGEVKLLLLDSIGCALAGLTSDPGKMAVAMARRLGGPPESSIVGTGDKVSCSSAALANGELIRALDYDALMPGGHAPPGIIPPSLAIAESIGATGKDLILATAIGFEVAARVSSGLRGGFHFEGPELKDFQTGDRSGAAYLNFGAAAGVGRLLNLNQDKMTHALGIAGHLCQVLTNTKFTFGEHRHMLKYGVAGWQNTGGIMAALLAEMGYIGDTTVFDPRHGFWQFCGYEGWQPQKLTEGLGETWRFTRVNYKPYPCCGMLHTVLDCFYSIIDQNNLMPEDIESVKAYGHPVFELPLFTNRELNSIVDVQFGLHYVLAIAAHRVRIGVEWQDLDMVRSPDIVEFSKRVSFQAHPDFGKRQIALPGSSPGKVEVVAKGKKLAEERNYPRGTPAEGLGMTEAELVDKFRHNASRILSKDKIDGAVESLLELETVTNIRDLMAQITI